MPRKRLNERNLAIHNALMEEPQNFRDTNSSTLAQNGFPMRDSYGSHITANDRIRQVQALRGSERPQFREENYTRNDSRRQYNDYMNSSQEALFGSTAVAGEYHRYEHSRLTPGNLARHNAATGEFSLRRREQRSVNFREQEDSPRLRDQYDYSRIDWYFLEGREGRSDQWEPRARRRN